jgi:hypothetical protein
VSGARLALGSAPTAGGEVSLLVIVVVMTVCIAASLLRSRQPTPAS